MADEDLSAQSGDPEAQSGSTGGGSEESDHETDVTGGGEGNESDKGSVSLAEFEALRNRMRGADQAKAKAEAELRQLRDKDMPQIEKLTRDLDETTKRAEAAEAALGELRVETEFLKYAKTKWKNPATALKLLDRSSIEVGEDGKVTGMETAIQALAKSDPYLVADESEAANSGSSSGGGSSGATGGVNKGTKRSDGLGDLASRVPALRNRMGK